MIALNYQRLKDITKNQKPYRGTTNRFPIGSRLQNTKCIYVENEHGQEVFDVSYGSMWERIELTKEEYEERVLTDKRIQRYKPWDADANDYADEYVYSTANVKPNILGRVRPDNSFEFTAVTIHQGERQILSNWSRGYFTNDSRRGGTIYRNGQMMIPIFRGLRVDCDTMRPITDYQVIGKKVKRKTGKDLLTGYEHFYKVAEVMFKNMDWKTFMTTAIEVAGEHTTKTKREEYHQQFMKLGAVAETLKDTAPIDAAILFMLQMDTGRIRWEVSRALTDGMLRSTSLYDDTPEVMFFSLKRHLNKQLYKMNSDVFEPVVYTVGESFPPSEWGVTVKVGNKEATRYGYGV